MLHRHGIQDLGHPEIRPYLKLRDDRVHREQGIFIAEGAKITERLLASGVRVRSLLLPEKWLDRFLPLIEQHPEDIHAFVGPKPDLEKLAGISMYQGVNSVGEIPSPPTLTELLQSSASPRLFIAIDDLTGADNVGTVARNGLAFGAQAMIVGDTCCSAWVRKAVRTSMGTIFKLPALETSSLASALDELRQARIQVIAAHAHTDEHKLSNLDLTRDTCLVLGSEGQGLREEVLKACDHHAIVPMANDVDSLNVGSAGAVFLYEVARQRGQV
ncbi:MAG: TrmH family RNA methyltransferase [Limisphaerales bacterium]